MYIRNTHRLLTIRIDLQPDRSGGRLMFTTFHGTEALVRHDVPAEAVGIRPDMSIRAYRGGHFQLPPDVAFSLAASLRQRADGDEPMWLQVGFSGGQLAVVPWERLFQPILQAPLLRVPNFLADPVFLAGRLRLALVVSSPRTNTPFPVAEYTRWILQTAQDAVAQGTDIDVFADLDAYNALALLAGTRLHHHVTVHDPHGAALFGGGATNTAVSWDGALQSPWLRWIVRTLAGRSVDAVHFVCPGFFRGDQGALAVARSPAENVDREWSHMIGVGELMAFLDAAGAWAAAFSPPFDDVWAMGVRLLVDRLAWQRPGALLVHSWEQVPTGLAEGYRFLFADHDEPPPREPSLMVYTHPKRMPRYRGVTGFESVSRLGFAVAPDEAIPEQLGRLAYKAGRDGRTNIPTDEAAWKRSAQLQLDQMLTRLGDEDTPSRGGALDAIERVKEILARSNS
jgi:hypothetical protein